MDDWKVLYSGTTQVKLNYLSRQAQQLQVENAKLREALQEIAERDPVDHTDISPDIAQAALEGKQDG